MSKHFPLWFVMVVLWTICSVYGQNSATAAEAIKIQIADGVFLEMARISAGTFMMGSPSTELNRDDDETLHEVTLTRDFWIGIYEVTQEQYEAVMNVNPSHFKEGGNYPVECISWNDAKEFCQKLNENSQILRPEGYHFDLPSEAQWEYACRAGTHTAFYWGNTLNGDKANCDGEFPYGTSTSGPYLKKTTPVGKYKNPNPWGLFDTHGNVWEWTLDHAVWQNASVRTRNYDGPQTNPLCTHGNERIYRGGGWVNYSRACRAAYRRCREPIDTFFDIGMRLALVAD